MSIRMLCQSCIPFTVRRQVYFLLFIDSNNVSLQQ